MNENEQYHADTTRISKSGIDLINKTPANYYQRYLNPVKEKQKPSKPLIIGSAFHAYILERDEFNSMFVILPHFKGKGSRDLKEKFILDNSEKQVLTMDEFNTIVGMAEAIQRHPIASKLINESGFAERVFHWTDETTGALCKCKPDRYNTMRNLIIDLKSTDDSSDGMFKFSAKKFRYYVQDSFYTDGMISNGYDVKGFVFIAVEKSPPYLVNVFTYGDNEKQFGRSEYKRNLKTYIDSKTADKWDGYSNEIKTLEIPGLEYM